MEEQSQDRHSREEVEREVQDAQEPYRTPKQRIIASMKARGLGYVLIAILLLASLTGQKWLTGHFVEPRNFFFVERDPSLSFPYKTNTVPSWSLAFIGAIGPLFLIILTQTLLRKSSRGVYYDKRTKDIHLVIIVLGEVLAITWLITNILKVYVGRLRPNFFDYCNYKGYREAIDTNDFTAYFAVTIPGQPGTFADCLNDKSDAHFSFPSGHASIAFCGLTFLTFFMLHVTARINFKHHAIGKIIRSLIVLVPLFSGALVAASRVIDYQHNVEDIIWGALIGILGAFLAFHANYGYKRPTKPGIPIAWGHIQPEFYPPSFNSNNPNLTKRNVGNNAANNNLNNGNNNGNNVVNNNGNNANPEAINVQPSSGYPAV